MTVFQLLMLGASVYFAFKIYEHVQTLQDSPENSGEIDDSQQRGADTFSPFSPEALVEKADLAYEEDDYKKALALLIEANAKDPNNPDILFKMGFILQKNGDSDDALKYYKEAFEIDKNDEFIHNAMASIYREKGEFSSAKLHLQASINIDNKNPITYYNYGNLLVDMNNNEEAISMYENALELDPELEPAKEELKKLKGE